MMCSAALNAVASAGVWSLTGDVLRALRQDAVALDQRLAAQLVTCFGRLGDIASAEAIFEVSRQNPSLKLCRQDFWRRCATFAGEHAVAPYVARKVYKRPGCPAGDCCRRDTYPEDRELPALGASKVRQVRDCASWFAGSNSTEMSRWLAHCTVAGIHAEPQTCEL